MIYVKHQFEVSRRSPAVILRKSSASLSIGGSQSADNDSSVASPDDTSPEPSTRSGLFESSKIKHYFNNLWIKAD